MKTTDILNSMSLPYKYTIAMINYMIADSDSSKPNKNVQQNIVIRNIANLKIDQALSIEFLKNTGTKASISNLVNMSDVQKEHLVIMMRELITCNGESTKKELQMVGYVLELMGISEKALLHLLHKADVLGNHFK